MLTPQFLILIFEICSLLFLVSLIHRFRKTLNLQFFVIFLTALIVLVQWLSDLGSIFFYQGYALFIASTVLFPAILFSLLLIFIFDGPVETRKLFYGLLIGEASYVLICLLLFSLNLVPAYFNIETTWLRNHFFSTLAVVADFYFITNVWSLFSKKDSWLLPKIFIIILGVTWLDSAIFDIGAFAGNSHMISILSSDIYTRAVLALLVTPIAYTYIQLEKHRRGFKLESRYPWSVLTSPNEAAQQLAVANKKIQDLEVLQQKLEEMSLVANHTSTGVYIADQAGAITWVNQSFTNITGNSLIDVQGKKRQDILLGPETNADDQKNFAQAMTTQQPFSGEILNYTKTGIKIWLHIEVTPVFEQQKLVKYIGVETEITALRNAKQQTEENNRELKRLNDLMVGRELKMVEMKAELDRLKKN